jgi:hypothetical protein
LTQDEIIEKAKETLVLGPYESATGFNAENAIKFAKLVAQHEREACAKLCDEIATEDGWEGGYAYRCVEAIRARGHS